MAQHDVGTATVDRIADAKVGDVVWLFDTQQALHDAYGKYLGRGVWKLHPIVSETRASFVLNYSKFDRKTGSERARSGHSSTLFIFGEKDKDDYEWRCRHRRSIVNEVESASTETLRRIADVIGWKP